MKAGRYALVEADSLRSTHDEYMRPTPDYPKTLARPNWSRADAEQRIQGITGEFAPDRLGEALKADDGAPVITPDGIVQAGDARTLAIKRVYQAKGLKAESYRQHLRENASTLDIDTVVAVAINNPRNRIVAVNTHRYFSITAPQPFTIDPRALTSLTPTAYFTDSFITYKLGYQGDLYLHTRATNLYGLLMQTGGLTGLNYWRAYDNTAARLVPSIWTVWRRTAYLTPV